MLECLVAGSKDCHATEREFRMLTFALCASNSLCTTQAHSYALLLYHRCMLERHRGKVSSRHLLFWSSALAKLAAKNRTVEAHSYRNYSICSVTMKEIADDLKFTAMPADE